MYVRYTDVKPTTQKAAWIRNNAMMKGETRLENVYKCPSGAKWYAFRECQRLCEELNGKNFHIQSHTCQAFTVGFYNDDYYYYFTSSYSYRVKREKKGE